MITKRELADLIDLGLKCPRVIEASGTFIRRCGEHWHCSVFALALIGKLGSPEMAQYVCVGEPDLHVLASALDASVGDLYRAEQFSESGIPATQVAHLLRNLRDPERGPAWGIEYMPV